MQDLVLVTYWNLHFSGLEIGGGPGANDHLKLRRAP